MRKVLFVVLVSWSSCLSAQSTGEVKNYIEDLVLNYQPSDYNYGIGYADEVHKEFIEEFMPISNIPNSKSLLLFERCSNNFNLCRINMLDLKGIRRILVLDEEDYISVRFILREGYISKEYVKALDDTWEEDEDSNFPPMILLNKGNIGEAKKLKKAFVYLIKEFGGIVERDFF
ncbi:MAG: hypothetical protein RIG77_00780 [Cyclobacteriaceae bacterium]